MRRTAETQEPRGRLGGEGAAAPTGGISGLKLVLLGALSPVLVAGAMIGGMLVINAPREEAASDARDEAALDCRSPRNSWRWACQQATSNEGYGVSAAATAEGPAVTGSVERQATARSSTAKTASGEPVRGSDTVAAPKTAWAEPAPEKVVEASASKPGTPKEAAKKPPAAAFAPMNDEEVPRATASVPAKQQPAAKPEPATPVKAPAQAAAAEAPTPKVTPTAPQEPAIARAMARVTSPSESVKPERAERRKADEKAAAAEAEEPAPRLSRKRAKAPVAAAKPRAVAKSSVVSKRARTARAPTRDEAPAGPGYRVMSLRTYTLPDGRRVVVQSAPRPEVVRDLLAEHRATFGRRQFARPVSGYGYYADDW
jgi:hypothetical protein